MRIEIDGQAWDKGFEDGEQGESLFLCPYEPGTTESLSWVSGYIEGKAARNEYSAPATEKKRAAPLSPTLFRYAPQLRAQRRKSPPKEGSRLDADRGSIFHAD
jgi:ribosome modulation factor